MELFCKATAGILVAAILAAQLNKQDQDIGLLLKTACCTMTAMVAMSYFSPVVEFLKTLEQMADLQSDILGTLLKCLGVGIAAELTSSVCTDAGASSLGKTLNLLGTAVMLYLSLPVFNTLIELIRQILEET